MYAIDYFIYMHKYVINLEIYIYTHDIQHIYYVCMYVHTVFENIEINYILYFMGTYIMIIFLKVR